MTSALPESQVQTPPLATPVITCDAFGTCQQKTTWITATEYNINTITLSRRDDAQDQVVVSEVWDLSCQCMRTVTQTVFSTKYSTKTQHRTVTVEPATSTTSSSLPQPTSDGSGDSSTAKGSGIQVQPGNFAGMWLGLSGGCLQRRSGVLVCTSSSLCVLPTQKTCPFDPPVHRLNNASFARLPNYKTIYDQSELAANVTAQLPTDTSGAGIGILVGLLAFLAAVLSFVFALSPSLLVYGPQDFASTSNSRRHGRGCDFPLTFPFLTPSRQA